MNQGNTELEQDVFTPIGIARYVALTVMVVAAFILYVVAIVLAFLR